MCPVSMRLLQTCFLESSQPYNSMYAADGVRMELAVELLLPICLRQAL